VDASIIPAACDLLHLRLAIPEEQITVLATGYTRRLLDAAEAGPA